MYGIDAFGGAAGRLRAAPLAGLAATTALLLATLFAGTAAASHVNCGDVITESTTLDSDVGPCTGDGLIVRADNITLDLNGHRVFATEETNGPTENVGIRLGRVSNVKVHDGTVEGFDAGVAIIRGGRNKVEDINVLNNVNDLEEPFVFVPRLAPANQPDVAAGRVSEQEWRAKMLCDYGDGITTFASDRNIIRNNRVIGNGPYGGITLVDDSDRNLVQSNTVEDNNVLNRTTQNTQQGPQTGPGLCGATLPGAPGMQRGRVVQAIGIRIEGPNAQDNKVLGNDVDNSALVGISIHSYVANPAPGEPRTDQEPNTDNLIANNDVRRTGAETFELDPFADGIASLAQGPIGRITAASPDNKIINNTSNDNMRHGISLGRTVEDTQVSGNTANNNAEDGIRVFVDAINNRLLGNKAAGNGEHDGHDDNEDCDENRWRGNRFTTVNQPCVR